MHTESETAELLTVVREIVACENDADATRAAQIISERFGGITRAKGTERDRAELLDDIAHPGNRDFQRQLEVGSTWFSIVGDLAVVRTVVTTSNRRDTSVQPQRFRNTHVFEREAGTWRCVAWQVTELK
jgi:hypothetical protein